MNPKGGTEILREQLLSKIDFGDINLITSICHPDLVKKDKINILWQHLSYDQPNVQMMKDRKFVDSIDYFIYVSHWQYNKFRQYYKIPEYKSFVIKNATDPIELVHNLGDKIKLIYTSTPWRGLSILIRAIEILNKTRDDFKLDVYSSTKIYGDKFYETEEEKFKELFEKCKNTPNVNYFGYASNEDVRDALSNSHIYAYPSIFEETSCLSIIEAMIAGCHTVTTNIGALPETCAEFATMIEIDSNGNDLAQKYANTLGTVIDNFKANVYNDDIRMQIEYYTKYYTWKTRIEEWRNFLQYVRKEKH